MGKRGPRPQPTKLKLLKGEEHRDRINDDEPEPAPADPVLPDEVAEEVRAVWDATVLQLQAMGLAYAADSDSLRCYCEAVVSHRRASAVLAKTGVLVKGLHGNWVRNPALQIQRDAATTVRGFAQEFGLTPSARSQLGAGNDPPAMGAERLLS